MEIARNLAKEAAREGGKIDEIVSKLINHCKVCTKVAGYCKNCIDKIDAINKIMQVYR